MKNQIYQMPKTGMLLMTFLILTSILFFACEGPKGDKGNVGPQGPQGAQGEQGATGNVNIHSKTYTVYSSSWTAGSSRADAYLYPTFLTSDIVNNGVVLVFMRSESGSKWQSIPITWVDGSVYRYWYSIQAVNLEYFDNYNPGIGPGFTATYKVVAFGGSYKSSLPEGLDLSDHDAVIDFINFQK